MITYGKRVDGHDDPEDDGYKKCRKYLMGSLINSQDIVSIIFGTRECLLKYYYLARNRPCGTRPRRLPTIPVQFLSPILPPGPKLLESGDVIVPANHGLTVSPGGRIYTPMAPRSRTPGKSVRKQKKARIPG
jgi:hypothetical protein